ncbi:FAD-dependent oxidoreductase [Burkholderia sp. Ax-1719]|uniref:flavin monoamine oxidase family protein n=1 Tax=Burkholderia sp. Ax-1719 TaxID=2608334 RepID=UPI00141E90A2|nr:FAD-dependent oxidoreductase [Burkholderia sp. Ax-1719]NIE62710.1 NAD(P)-binding protein [Burkholderia sp. Ax-1719]
MNARIGIIGGGLAGLYAALRLQARGIEDFVLLEAAGRFGGRIETVTAGHDDARFDLGPTWFWPEIQPELDHQVCELGLERFAQHETGDTLIERSPDIPPTRTRGYPGAPTAMRLVGGMSALTEAIQARLAPQRLHGEQRVTRIAAQRDGIDIHAANPQGRVTTYRVDRVMLALPPRLAVASIEFSPALPDALTNAWRETPTWMAPHAKYLAVYPRAFWRERGLSGEARSASGPLAEIHDAATVKGDAALFGFIGLPTDLRARVGEAALLAACRAQLVRLFGKEAAEPRLEVIKDWAAANLTATAADRSATPHHWGAPESAPISGAWRGRLAGIGSEWSTRYPGYLAGAIDAAEAAIGTMFMESAS